MIDRDYPPSSPDTAPVFAALGDPYRLAIIERLCRDGPLPTAVLNDARKLVSRQGLTKHLRVLEGAGLVDSFRMGRDRHWRVRADRLTALGSYLDEVAALWQSRLARLKIYVESEPGPP